MDAGFPVPQFGTVALAAQFIGFFEIQQPAVGQVQFVAVFGVVAVQAPAVFFVVFQYDVVVKLFQFPAFRVGFPVGMTFRAGKNVFAERRRRDLDVLGRRVLGGSRVIRKECGEGQEAQYPHRY